MSRFVLTAQLQLQAPTNVGQVVRQIQSQLNNVQVNVQVQGTQQAQRQLNNVTTSTNQAANAATRLGQAFGLSIKRFAAFSIATRAVTLFTSTLSNAIKEAIAFERELTKISQVTGKSLSQLRDLTDEINRLSRGFGVSSTSLLGVSRILSQAGLNADETRIALDALAKTELAPTFDNITETAEGAVAIFNQFRLGAEALEEQLGSINAVAGRFAVEAGDLIGVVRRVGGVFKASGGDLNELIALFTSVRATTRESAESIATGLRTIFTRIQRPETIQFLKQFGVELLDLEGKFVGPFEATKRLSQALAGLGQGDITFIKIAEELGGFRQIGKVIPLLQQFAVAQEALNVAQQGSGSLADDAAKAQLALAVRITKVKEEFLSLVRSITETTSFQLFANTVLNLASALIKLADAFKPIIPLLTAFAGIKLAAGIGGFLRGVGGGLRTPRGFATGGLVPGSGNRDTVPAMLTPGEFVIRKSSVSKLGAGNLAAMNENRYAAGGEVVLRVRPNKFGGMFLSPPTEGDSTINAPQGRQVSPTYSRSLIEKLQNSGQFGGLGAGTLLQTGSMRTTPVAGQKGIDTREPVSLKPNSEGAVPGVYSTTNESRRFGNVVPTAGFRDFIHSESKGKISAGSKDGVSLQDPKIRALLNLYTGNARKKATVPNKIASVKIAADSGSIPSLVANTADMNAGLQDEVTQITYTGMKNMVSSVINSSTLTSKIGPERLKKIRPNIKKSVAKLFNNDPQGRINSARAAIEGYLFEGIIGGITGKFPESGGALFDFMYPGKGDAEGWTDLFGPQGAAKIALLTAADAKRSATSGNKEAIVDKVGKYLATAVNPGLLSQFVTADPIVVKKKALGGLIHKFATGGAVGTDTVPALLTPGEFVINRSSAQKIGYGSLNRMNKVGKYAKGGVVQRFNTGGGVTSKSVKANIGGLADNGALQREIAATAQEIKKTGSYAKILSTSLDKQSKITNTLYQESSALDKRISGYDRALAQIASQQGKAAATGKAADRILKMKMDAEQRRIDVDNKALAEEQKLEGIKKKYAQTMEKQTQLMDQKSALIGQAKSNKQAATQLTQESLKGGTQGSFREFDRQTHYREVRAKNKERQSMPVARGDGKKVDTMGAIMAIGMLTAGLQSMLPPLDANASMLTKMAHGGLNLINTLTGVAFALQAFGIQLKASSVMSFLGGGGLSKGFKQGIIDKAQGMGFSRNATAGIVKFSDKLVSAIGPIIATVAAIKVLSLAANEVANALFGNAEKLKQVAIEQGNVEEAGKQAGIQSRRESATATIGGFATAGAAIGGSIAAFTGTIAGSIVGSIVPVLGTTVGGIVAGLAGTLVGSIGGAIVGGLVGVFVYATGLISDPVGQFAQEAANTAMAIAANNAATKALRQAQLDAARAAEQFKNGTISATDYLNTFSTAARSMEESRKYSGAVVKQATEQQSTGFGAAARNLGVILGGGLFGMEFAGTRNKRLTEEATGVIKTQRENEATLFSNDQAARDAVIKQTLARGGTEEQAREQIKRAGYDTEAMQQRAGDIKLQARAAYASGNAALGAELDAQVNQLLEQAKSINFAFENIAKEVERSKKAFEAMNLGFSGVSATAGALSASLNNYLARQEAGYNALDTSVTLLEASLTNAAQGISENDFKNALNDASNGLKQLGANQAQIEKFEENMTAVNTAQRFFAQASQETKDALKAEFERGASSGGSAEERKASFADAISNQLANAGIEEEVRNRLKDAIMGGQLTDDQINDIGRGDLSGLQSLLDGLGKTISDQTIGPLRELAKYNQLLADMTKKRIDIENQVVSAQQNLIAAQAEAAEIIAKYGGPAFTPQMQTQSILDQANVQSDAAGVSRLNTGSAAELNQRSAEARAGLDRIAQIRQGAAAGNGAAQAQLAGESGVRLQEQEKRLQELAKSDYDTTKKLIQQKEKELQVIQEKNKAEKAAIDSLLAGDIDKWFEQQAAVGATAAIATGNQELMNAFGAKAVGMAAQDIKRQQDAGVQTLYGQQLAGPGGLTERGYAAGLGMRGVSSPQAMAQIAAGTTGEEEAAKSEIRALAATLPNYAQTQLEVAENSLQTADIQYQAAEMQLQAAKTNVQNNAGDAAQPGGVAAMFRGGPVYANNGIFVPRGTDTVPAMLTPGEFVVRRAAVQRGNNLQILQAMNRGQSGVSNSGGAVGMANGGEVQYLRLGNRQPIRKIFGSNQETTTQNTSVGISPELINQLSSSLNKFNTDLTANIDRLNSTTFNVKLDNTNINVNLTGGSFLSNLNKQIQDEVLKTVGQEITNYRAVDGGKLQKDTRVT